MALAGSAPPQERKRWSWHLLAGKLVAAEVVDGVSHEMVRQTPKRKCAQALAEAGLMH